jgi:hypothetical protein
MAFCDGRVQSINYAIDMDSFLMLCNRQDGAVIGDY